jgi:hypothetical protein
VISLRYSLASQAIFPTNTSRVLSTTVSPAIVAATSAGWCTQPWPGEASWPMASLVPKLLFGQVETVASEGDGWLLSAWPGRGVWPYTFPSRDLRCQYSAQWEDKPLGAQLTLELSPSQTNLGSNDTTFCGRDFCSSGLFVAEAWMWKSLFCQNVFYLKAQKILYCACLIPSKVNLIFAAQYLLEFPVDNVGPFTQIYCSTEPLFFSNKLLGSQYWAERTRILQCQWKKRPF